MKVTAQERTKWQLGLTEMVEKVIGSFAYQADHRVNELSGRL